MPHCKNCDTVFESAEDVETEEVGEIEHAEGDSETPQIQIGTDKRDLWRCKGCGKVLGVE